MVIVLDCPVHSVTRQTVLGAKCEKAAIFQAAEATLRLILLALAARHRLDHGISTIFPFSPSCSKMRWAPKKADSIDPLRAPFMSLFSTSKIAEIESGVRRQTLITKERGSFPLRIEQE